MATLTITKSTDERYELAYVLRDIQTAAQGIETLTSTAFPDEHYPTSITLSGPAPAIEQVFRYFYRNADAVMSAADNLEYRKYREIITDAAQGIRDEIAAGDYEDADALTEAIESAGDVIYYSEAALTLRHSSNDAAYLEHYGADEAVDDCVKASFAQAADLHEELGDLEELLNTLSPLSDDEKRDAYAAYCEWDAANAPEDAGDAPDQTAQRDAIYDIAHRQVANAASADRLTAWLQAVIDGEEDAPTLT